MGWTWDYVAENIDLPRLKHLNAYWAAHPPVHILVAAYMGYKGQKSAQEQEESADEVISMLGGNTLSESEFEALLKEKGLM